MDDEMQEADMDDDENIKWEKTPKINFKENLIFFFFHNFDLNLKFAIN